MQIYRFNGIEASEIIFKLDEKNICVSSGSACSSGNASPSHVLTAIDTPDEYINSAIRTTFSEYNTFEEIDYLVKAIVEIVRENKDKLNQKLLDNPNK